FDFKLAGDFTQDNFVMNILSEIQKMDVNMGGIAYAKNMHIKLKTDVDADMPNMKFTLKENEININELGLGVDGFVAMPDTNINMDLKFFAKQTEFKNILSLIPAVYSKDFASVQTAGKLALNGFAKGTYNASTLPAFGLHLEITEAMFKYPSLPKSVSNINIITDIQNPNGKPDATVIDVNKFHIEMAGNPVDMIMHVKTPVSDPNLHGEIKGIIDLTSVKDIVPLEKGDDMSGVIKADVKMQGKMSSITKKQYQDFKAEGTFEVDKMNYKTSTLPYSVLINQMKLNFTPQVVELTTFDSKLGNSDIQMQGKIENFMQYIFQDSLIKGNFKLTSNLMDLNQLMSSSTTSTTATMSTATPATSTVTAVPANIDFVLNTDIKKMLYDKMEITNVAGNVVVRNARASMQDVKMNMLDGALLMNGYYDTKDMRKPAINFNLNANDFDIQKTVTTFNTVKTLAPIANAAHGKFTATLNNFTGILKPDMSPDLTTLTGNGVFQTKSVAIQDYPVFVKLDDALHLNKLKNITVNDVNLS
ncbi:MAG: AsmA-like C-terminal region-containing protein, partial [Bacteroidia bacterium]